MKYPLFSENGLFEDWLKNTQPSSYQYIYFSLGSKYNENTFLLNFPERVLHTNADAQMFPHFLRNRLFESPQPKILCICVDSFTLDGSIGKNEKIVSKILEPYDPIPSSPSGLRPVDFVFYDTFATIQIFETLIQTFMNWLMAADFPPSRFMIANFIRFYQPNNIECLLEEKLPPAILSILRHTNYANCFFQWFGYVYTSYNLLYRYTNEFIITIDRRLLQLFPDTMIGGSDIGVFEIYAKKNLWQQIVDLQSPSLSDNIANEVCDFFDS